MVMGKIFENLFIDLDFGVVLFCVWGRVCMFEIITFILYSCFTVLVSFSFKSLVMFFNI